MPLRLRVRGPAGIVALQGLEGASTVEELQAAIAAQCGVPAAQQAGVR